MVLLLAESLPSMYMNYYGKFCHLTDYEAAKLIEESEEKHTKMKFVPCSDSIFNKISTANRIKDESFV